MKVSVIIPTYNEEKVIGECLLSLSKQTVKDFEVIVVDDGSTDKTVEVLSQVSAIKCQVFQQDHKGPGVARNLGAKSAKGDILAFVDADMTFDPNFLQKLIKPIEHKTAKGTFSREEYVSNWDNIWARCWNLNEGLPDKRRLPVNYPDHQKVFRAILKSEFERVGGFTPGGYTDDYSLSEKLGYEATAADDAIFYHKNPHTLGEVFSQAKWVGKRKYKFGILGVIIALFRVSLPVSVILGLYKAVKVNNLQFVIFKIVCDFGVFIGLLNYLIFGNAIK